MSDTQIHDDPEILTRTFATEITPGDGRTVDVRLVKYGERAIAADGGGGRPKGVPYFEEFAPGFARHQTAAAHRLKANGEHEQGVAGIVARGVAMREEPDALYASFVFLKTPNGDTANELVREGVWDSVSMEFRPAKSVRLADGAIRRLKATIHAVAFTSTPAYESSKVVGLREEEDAPELLLDEALLPVKVDPELLARIAALGVALPDGLRAEEIADTSAETDTSA